MTTLEMNQVGFSQKGIENFLKVIESVLPHTPGNWEFISINEKLQFVSKHKESISSYLQNSKPQFSDEECEAFNWFNYTDENKIKRLSEIQSASVTLWNWF